MERGGKDGGKEWRGKGGKGERKGEKGRRKKGRDSKGVQECDGGNYGNLTRSNLDSKALFILRRATSSTHVVNNPLVYQA